MCNWITCFSKQFWKTQEHIPNFMFKAPIFVSKLWQSFHFSTNSPTSWSCWNCCSIYSSLSSNKLMFCRRWTSSSASLIWFDCGIGCGWTTGDIWWIGFDGVFDWVGRKKKVWMVENKNPPLALITIWCKQRWKAVKHENGNIITRIQSTSSRNQETTQILPK